MCPARKSPRPRPRPHAAAVAEPRRPETSRTARREEPLVSTPAASGQTVATRVKLDENRYLRLADAAKPGPGQLKRRTIREMVIEALDKWFEWRAAFSRLSTRLCWRLLGRAARAGVV